MRKVSPNVDEFENLEVSFDEESNHGWFRPVIAFAHTRDNATVTAIAGFVVIGIACCHVKDSWAAVAISTVITSLAITAMYYGKKENRSNELGDESGSEGETGAD